MLVYIDDCLAVHHDPGLVMEDLNSCYKLKNDMYGVGIQTAALLITL